MAHRSNWVAVLVGLIALSVVLVIVAAMWTAIGEVAISTAGWIALVLGVLATLALGVGLMALVFISSRRGYDDGGSDRR